MERVVSVSVDLDSLACYYQIHGLGPVPPELESLILHTCLPRFVQLFEACGVPATLFVVARDVDVNVHGDAATRARSLLRDAAAKGIELASHSYSHPYSMAGFDGNQVARELELADAILAELAGDRIEGFRAPGYDVSATMLTELARLGYTYDSSVLPAPAYYAAKASVMGAMKLLGKTSGAVLTDPRLLSAPIGPYRPDADAPWRRGQASVVELPIAVTPVLRVPVIGTSLIVAPLPLRRAWLRSMRKRRFFNLELHGIDLADAELDGIPGALVDKQPDLRVPLARKLCIFEDILRDFAREAEFATLRDAATWVQREFD